MPRRVFRRTFNQDGSGLLSSAHDEMGSIGETFAPDDTQARPFVLGMSAYPFFSGARLHAKKQHSSPAEDFP